jgi:glycerol-3-phosphate acyltransferase PlsY
VWGIVFFFSRYASLASIIAAIASPIAAYLLLPYAAKYVLMVFVLSTMLVWRHRSNIQKLLAGTESGFGKK